MDPYYYTNTISWLLKWRKGTKINKILIKKVEVEVEMQARGTHRGGYRGRIIESKNQGDSKTNEKNGENSSRGNYNRGRGFNSGGKGRFGSLGRSSHLANMKCYNCGGLEHLAYRYPDKETSSA